MIILNCTNLKRCWCECLGHFLNTFLFGVFYLFLCCVECNSQMNALCISVWYYLIVHFVSIVLHFLQNDNN